jgi:hypothetical protein
MMSSTSEQYDAKKFPLCAPWDGQRGKSYQETFIPNMTSSWGLRGDDFANKQEHLTGTCPAEFLSPPLHNGLPTTSLSTQGWRMWALPTTYASRRGAIQEPRR